MPGSSGSLVPSPEAWRANHRGYQRDKKVLDEHGA